MIRLATMTEEEFSSYLAVAVDHYAQEHVAAGRWSVAEAHAEAAKEFQLLLPDGLHSQGQHLHTLVDDQSSARVGMIWFGVREEGGQAEAWIWDIHVWDEFQGRGYGRQALSALDETVRALGLTRIALHVFAHNHTARHLYDTSGYHATNIMMRKEL
ncbi:MAG: GNAT family N-acetyltransferase [Sulfobacillus sp.]